MHNFESAHAYALDHASEMLGGSRSLRTKKTGRGDRVTHFVEAGEGETLIFLHGFPSFWYCWLNQLIEFAPTHRVVALDALGSGASAKSIGDDHYNLESLVTWLDQAIDSVSEGKKVTLIGHDWGGMLAWSYAERHADKLSALVIMSAVSHSAFLDQLRIDPEQRARSAYISDLCHAEPLGDDGIDWSERLFEACYRDVIENGRIPPLEADIFRAALQDKQSLNASLGWYRANLAPSLWKTMGQSGTANSQTPATPTLLINGKEDTVLSPALLKRVPERFPEIELVQIDDCGHWTPFESPRAVNAAIRAFLDGIAR